VVIEEDGLQETSGAEKRYGSGGRVECPMSNAVGRRRRPPQKAAATRTTASFQRAIVVAVCRPVLFSAVNPTFVDRNERTLYAEIGI
jgi:hypothetical protein